MNPGGLTDIERMERLKELSRQRSADLNASGWQLVQPSAPSEGMGAEMAASIKPQMGANVGSMMASNPQLTQAPEIGPVSQMPSRDQMFALAGQLGQIGQLEQVPMLQVQRGGGTYVAQPPQMRSYAPPMPTKTAEVGDGQDKKGLLAMLDELMKKQGAAQ